MDFDCEDDAQFAMITIFPNKKLGEIEVLIQMYNHKKDECPSFENNQICFRNTFKIHTENHRDLPFIELLIWETIFKSFPKSIFYYENAMIWDIYLNVEQIEELLMTKLTENQIFNNLKITYPENTEDNIFIDSLIYLHPMLKWTFNTIHKNSEITTERMTYNCIAKNCGNKILETAVNEGFDYFEPFATHIISSELFKSISFFNLFIFMNKEGIAKFKENYNLQLKNLEIDEILRKELISYCPDDYELMR